MVERTSYARPVPETRRVRWGRRHARGGPRRRRTQSGTIARSDRSPLGTCMDPNPARGARVAVEGEPGAARQACVECASERERLVDARRDTRGHPGRAEGSLSEACPRDSPRSRGRRRGVSTCHARIRRSPAAAEEATISALKSARTTHMMSGSPASVSAFRADFSQPVFAAGLAGLGCGMQMTSVPVTFEARFVA